MPIIWFMLDDLKRELLRKYQWRWHRKRLGPVNESPPVVLQTKIENTDEIARIMRQPPGPKWRRG